MIDIRPYPKILCNHKEYVCTADGTYASEPLIDVNRLLSYGASYRKVQSEEVIFMEGSEPVYYYQLVSGSVRWINDIDEDRAFIQDIIVPGECFGELPLFDKSPYTTSAIASENSLLIRLPKTVFHQLLSDNPEVHFTFTQMMARRMKFKFQMLKEISFCEPVHRLEFLLDYLKRNKRHYCTECNKLTLTRQQLADMTGLRVETVIRAVKSLEAQGKLLILHGKIYYKHDNKYHVS